MSEGITRERFSVWADNKIVNYLEDCGDIIYTSESGKHHIEHPDYSINCVWGDCNDDKITITIRAYVNECGWQTLEHNLKHIRK